MDEGGEPLEAGAASAVVVLTAKLLRFTQHEWRVIKGEGCDATLAPFTLAGYRERTMPAVVWQIAARVARDRGFKAYVGDCEIVLKWESEVDPEAVS